MTRVLSILAILPMLMPQGVCLRKFDCVGWMLRIPASAKVPTPVRAELSNERHPSSCPCGCQQQASQVDEGEDQACDSVINPRFQDNSLPSQPQEPCCPSICNSKVDKIIVQAENPLPRGEVVFVEFAPTPPTHTCLYPQHRLNVTVSSPPLYISFCTFLI